jgi:beta-glucosidase
VVPVEDDVDAVSIVAGLSLEEKVRLLSGRDTWHLQPVASAGLPSVMVTDGPHGLRKQVGDADRIGLGAAVPATCFPTASALAASWDEALLHEVGVALGRECRAEDVAVLLGPGVNLKRHPAGGRNFEYLSEDPLLAGRLAAALVRGVQSEGVGACLKHLAANHQETFRMVIDTVVDQRTLRELELAAFEIAVRESSPWTVMSAYNRLNGEYCSSSRWLLTEVLRDEWGFDGLVVTDWGAVDDRAVGIEAGLDLEMPGNGGSHDAAVLAAVAEGRLSEAAVDRCATRVVELVQRSVPNVTSSDTVDLDAHHQLARRAAAAGTVLLTNDGTLPLEPRGTIALVGAFAEHPRYQGAGSSQVHPSRLDTALDALRDRVGDGGEVRYAPGYDPVTAETSEGLVAEAVAAAAASDVTVLLVGLPGRFESEGFDRAHLRLPEGHTRLVEAVLEAAPRTVVVLSNGAPVELPWADRPAALVEGYLAGQASGSAIVDVLVGDAEPGGRLGESFPVRAEDLAADRNFPGRRRQVEHRECLAVGYRFHDTAGVPARFPFGHGLGYTTFDLDDLEVTGGGQRFEVRVRVTNTGPRRGSEVAQVYVRDVVSRVPRPDKELRGFARVELDPGESRTVTVELGPRAFAVYDVASSGWRIGPGAFEVVVGTSSVDVRATATIEVTSDDPPRPVAPLRGPTADDVEFAALLGRPIPRPDPVLPFHRNTAVADLAATRFGRRVQRLIVRTVGRQIDRETADGDEATRRMFEAVVAELPLRGLVLLGGGKVSFRALDALIDLLNGRSLGAVGRLLGPRGRRRPRRHRGRGT